MDLETAQTNATAKFPILKQGEYEMWRLRIDQFFQIQDYASWDVIENGNSFKPEVRTTANADGTSTLTIPGPITTEEKVQKKNDVKARNLDLMSFDDIYNNFKIVEQEVKRITSSDSSSNSQNMAFVSSPSSTNKLKTANVHVSTASSSVSTDSTQNSTASLSDATVYAFLTNQPNGSQLVHEDLEQIHEDDHEEMDLKCSKRTVNVEETTPKAMIAIDGVGFDWSFMAEEEVTTNMVLMAFSDSEEFQQLEFEGYGVKVNNSVYENSSNEIKKTPDAPIIEEWVSDSDEDESEVIVSDYVQHKPRQANQPRKVSQTPKNNRINCHEMKTQKLGVGFKFTKKACFVCGSLNHLIKDCDFHDKKMVQKPVLNNVKKGTGQKKVRPVWNNAMRSNHQNFSNSRRNFAPTAVLTKSGIVPIKTAKQSSSSEATPVSAARPINTAAPKPFMNVAQTRPNAFQKSHSLSRRPFYQQTTLKNRNLNNKVNTAKINSVNTAKGKRVTSTIGEQRINAVKSSAYWIWRPKRNVIDHIFKNSGSYIWEDIDDSMNVLLVLVFITTQQMVINSPCLIDKKELTIPGQTATGKELSNPLMLDSLPKTILPTKLME
ncbi:hypothetical protein Tco_0565393 [Tanacetum coccineum]